MKFKFSLDKVLNHRRIQVDIAKKNFISSQNKYLEAIYSRDQMIIEKENSIKSRSELVNQKTNWQLNVHQINQYLIGQDLRIERQNESLKILEKEVESYREILLKAQREAKIIDKLKENKKNEFIKNYYENENKELDEIATLRYVRINKE